jgi:predicted peptidase
MKKSKVFWVIPVMLLVFGLALKGCSTDSSTDDNPIMADPTFKLVNEVYRDGIQTKYVVIDTGGRVVSGVAKSSFSVYAHIVDPRTTPVEIYDGRRTVIDTWVSDSGSWNDSNNAPPVPAASGGKYIWLALEYGRDDTAPYASAPGASIIRYSSINVLCNLDYTVTQKEAFIIDSKSGFLPHLTQDAVKGTNEARAGEITPLVNKFAYGRYIPSAPVSEADYIDYRFYVPPDASSSASGSIPLVIWIHGAGEGRVQPTGNNGVPDSGIGGAYEYLQNVGQLIANEEGVAWVKPENQAARKAFVLLPQSPGGSWVATTSPVRESLPNVKNLIDKIILENPAIDTHRIYLAGDSMGGIGTCWMVWNHPNFFAAAIGAPLGSGENNSTGANPLSEAHANIIKNSNIPMWFVNIEGDFMRGHTFVTYNSLKAVGATNIRWSYYLQDDIVPGTGGGLVSTLCYGNGHGSWVLVLSNLCKTDDSFIVIDVSGTTNSPVFNKGPGGKNPNDTANQTIMEWLFTQKLP